MKEHRFRPERTRFVHKDCKGSKGDQTRARTPTPFPLASSSRVASGHLDDFPWHWFVHGGPLGCKGTLRFFESGASLQTENLWVQAATQCSASRNMAQAFGQGRQGQPAGLPRAPSAPQSIRRRLRRSRPRAVLLGATNGWFPVTLSALAIPQTRDPIAQLVQDGWDYLRGRRVRSRSSVVVKTLKKTARLPGIEKHSPRRSGRPSRPIKAARGDDGVTEADIKGPSGTCSRIPKPPTD